MNRRYLYPILVMLYALLASLDATPQESQPSMDVRAKFRSCDLQERMFDGYCLVSIIDLIANPELFDGRRVLVKGYVHIEFEHLAIYLHREDFRHGITRNSVALNVQKISEYSKCNNSYSYIRGKFHAGIGGHNDMFSGTIDEITECENSSSRRR
jgi:hypothetical protein